MHPINIGMETRKVTDKYRGNVKKVTDAIKLGNSSKWGQFIGGKIDFDDRNSETYDYQNVYYMRDRGEKDQGYRVYKNEAEYLAEGFNSGEEYIYLMKMDGKTDYMGRPIGTWYYSPYSNPEFKVLEEDAINDHIDMLKRHIEQMKKRQVA